MRGRDMTQSLAEIWLECVLGPKPAHLVDDAASVDDRLVGLAPSGERSVGDGQDAGNIGGLENVLGDQLVHQDIQNDPCRDAGAVSVADKIEILHDALPMPMKSDHHGSGGTSST